MPSESPEGYEGALDSLAIYANMTFSDQSSTYPPLYVRCA